MGRDYQSELDQLAETLRWARDYDISSWVPAKGRASTVSAIIVASGGSLVAAHFLQALYERETGRVATVATPLEYVLADRIDDADVWLLSAGGGNADILAAWRAVLERRPRHVFIVCAQPMSALVAAAKGYASATIYAFEVPGGRDGFLATNSLVAFLVFLARLFVSCRAIRNPTPGCRVDGHDTTALLKGRSLLVVYDPGLKAIALDVESRFSEAALGHVLTSDLRNFAHGRHVWLAKRGDTSSVLLLDGPRTTTIADDTRALLPAGVPLQRWTFADDDPWTVIDGVIASIRFASEGGRLSGIDPGRPGVPDFGSRLYGLAPRVRAEPRTWRQLAIESKAGRSLSRLSSSGEMARYEIALSHFEDTLRLASIKALSLDFDGTLVNTVDRFGPISQEVVDELTRLLEQGILLGIATGRGKSVRTALLDRFPSSLHERIDIGYYNCGVLRNLSLGANDLNHEPARPELIRAEAALRSDPDLSGWKMESRPTQITVEAGRVGLRERELWFRVSEVLARAEARDVKVVHSSHSVDILPLDVSKSTMVAHLVRRSGGACLQIGDRGLWPGNDAEMLAAPLSLSVDEVSCDLVTCWNLLGPGLAGIDGTLRYLRSIRHGQFELEDR